MTTPKLTTTVFHQVHRPRLLNQMNLPNRTTEHHLNECCRLMIPRLSILMVREREGKREGGRERDGGGRERERERERAVREFCIHSTNCP